MEEKIKEMIRNTIIDIKNIQSNLENNPQKTIYMYKKCQSANDKLVTVLQYYNEKETNKTNNETN